MLPDIPRPVVAAIDMGYGHLRAAAPLADALGVPMLQMDLPPLGDFVPAPDVVDALERGLRVSDDPAPNP